MPKITEFVRHKIIILHLQGHSQRQISKQTAYSRSGVQAVIKKFEESGQVEDRKRSGRPRKLSKSDEKFLRVSSLRDRTKSSKDLAQLLAASLGCRVDPSTVRRSLIRNGLHGRVAAKKPCSQKGNRVKRQRHTEARDDESEDPCRTQIAQQTEESIENQTRRTSAGRDDATRPTSNECE